MSDWIATAGKLPEKSQIVDVWHNGIRFPDCYLAGDSFESKWKYCSDPAKDKWEPKYIFTIKSVDFWMPLPEPPNRSAGEKHDGI